MNGSNCSWTASSPVGWASVTPLTSSGTGSVNVAVVSNAGSTVPRAATLTIAGQSISIQQDGTVCTYSLQSTAGSAPGAGGSGSVGVIAASPCGWTATSNNSDWLTITSAGASGAGTVNFSAQANTTAVPRIGTLMIQGLTYTLTQDGAPCNYTLSAQGVSAPASGSAGSFTFTMSATGCLPSVSSYAGWIHASSSTSGTSGSVSYTVDQNASASPRSGSIQVGTRTFAVTQGGAVCAFSLNSYNAYFSAAGSGDTDNFFLASASAAGCIPAVSVDLPDIVALVPVGAPVNDIFTQHYIVEPFTESLTAAIRKARISFNGTIFTIKQSSW
jgi:hypothetical protein